MTYFNYMLLVIIILLQIMGIHSGILNKRELASQLSGLKQQLEMCEESIPLDPRIDEIMEGNWNQ